MSRVSERFNPKFLEFYSYLNELQETCITFCSVSCQKGKVRWQTKLLTTDSRSK